MQMGSLLAVAASLALASVPAGAFAGNAVATGATRAGDCTPRTLAGNATSDGSDRAATAPGLGRMTADGFNCVEKDNSAPAAAVPFDLGSDAPAPAGWILIVAGVGMVSIGMRSRDQGRSRL